MISIIVPVYNVKQFVAKCAESLMSQTFVDAEFIFVDDASSDGSIAILEEILAKHPERNTRIIHHEKNCGLPTARKTGYEAATGEYIYNCDGDDWVEPTILEKLYAATNNGEIDYTYCDFYLTYEKSERYLHCPHFATADEALRIGYLGGTAKYNVWNKLIRRSLYEGVEFPVDHRKGGEDMIMFYVLSRAKTVAHVPEALYHYVKYNENAISEKFSEQRLKDIRYNADYAIKSVQRNCTEDMTIELSFFKLNVKLPFLITDDPVKYKIWKDWYPEANRAIMKNPYLPYRTKLLQWFAAHNMWILVKFYYFILYKIVYKSLYN